MWAEACANEKADLGADGAVQYYMDALGLNYDAQGYKDFMIWGTEIYTQEGKTTNWLDEVTRTGFTQNYSVDVQGGGAVAGTPSYYLSLDYLKDQAIVIGKDLQRYSFRFNFEHEPSKVVKFGFNTNFVYSERLELRDCKWLQPCSYSQRQGRPKSCQAVSCAVLSLGSD